MKGPTHYRLVDVARLWNGKGYGQLQTINQLA